MYLSLTIGLATIICNARLISEFFKQFRTFKKKFEGKEKIILNVGMKWPGFLLGLGGGNRSCCYWDKWKRPPPAPLPNQVRDRLLEKRRTTPCPSLKKGGEPSGISGMSWHWQFWQWERGVMAKTKSGGRFSLMLLKFKSFN
jgi:hypothetical protein